MSRSQPIGPGGLSVIGAPQSFPGDVIIHVTPVGLAVHEAKVYLDPTKKYHVYAVAAGVSIIEIEGTTDYRPKPDEFLQASTLSKTWGNVSTDIAFLGEIKYASLLGISVSADDVADDDADTIADLGGRAQIRFVPVVDAASNDLGVLGVITPYPTDQ